MTTGRQAGETSVMMSELDALKRISVYIAKSKINLALEAEENMVVEANKTQILNEGATLAIEPKPPDKKEVVEENIDKQRLDCIYDEEPLGFEKDLMALERIHPQDPLEEIDLGEKGDKRPTYISANIDQKLKPGVISLLKEFKDVLLGTITKCQV